MVPNGYCICVLCVSPCSTRNQWLQGNRGRRTLKSTYAPTLQNVQLRRCTQSELCPWDWQNCDELTLSTTMTAWISTEESLSLMMLTFAVLCMAKKSWFRREKVRMRSWMLRRENRQLSCLYYLGATNSLHYKDSRTTHICNIHWEPCILDQEIGVNRHFKKHSVLKGVTQSAYACRSRNVGNPVFLIKKLEENPAYQIIYSNKNPVRWVIVSHEYCAFQNPCYEICMRMQIA